MSDLAPGRPDLAVSAVLAGGGEARVRVCVDLSRFTTNRVVVDFDDFNDPARIPAIGDLVTAYDPDERQEATAEIVGLDEQRHTVSLVVDWDTIREATA